MNSFTEGDDNQTPILKIDPTLEQKQIDRTRAVRARRDSATVEASLVALKQAAANESENLMPYLLDAARAHTTEGELVQALQDVWGDYREAPVF